MAIPRVFVSSTCYDLHYIRENLKFFVREIGYEPVLSEEGAVFYDPTRHTHDACLAEVPTCQILVLIIGGRSGGKYRNGDKSITNAEYDAAISNKIPVFALVEQAVYAEHHVWLKNKANSKAKQADITFPSVDDTKIFSFIDSVRLSLVNNAIVSFRDFSDIKAYLRQQWAGMMFSFLSSKNEAERVTETLSALQIVNQRVEMLSRQILASVGTSEAKITAELYDSMIAAECIRDLAWFGGKPTPSIVLKSETYFDCMKSLNLNLLIEESDDFRLSQGGGSEGYDGKIEKHCFDSNSARFIELKAKLKGILDSHNMTADVYLASVATT